MTKQRINRLRNKIQDSRIRLMSSHPDFAMLLMYLGFAADVKIAKISTNGIYAFFNPDFLDRLYWYELDYVLCHLILHITEGHIWRTVDSAGDDYHFGCDIKINAMLRNSGFESKQYSHLGYVKYPPAWDDTSTAELTPEEILSHIPLRLSKLDEKIGTKYLADSDCRWGSKDGIGKDTTLIISAPDADPLLRVCVSENQTFESNGDSYENSSEDELRQLWDSRVEFVRRSVNFGESKNNGDIESFLRRIVPRLQKPTLDWKRILNNFIQEEVCDYSFAPPDRRFSETGFFLPDYNETNTVTKEILFMVDTSGSVRDEDIALVYSEIRGAIEQFNGKLTGLISFFDTQVERAVPFDTADDLMKIIPVGGGNTDFFAIFDYLQNSFQYEMPSSIIIFTDGYSSFPDEKAAMGVPVLWIINNNEITPPWGKTARVILSDN